MLVAPRALREVPRLGRRIRRAFRSSVVVAGLVVAVLIVLVAVLAGVLAPVAPDEQNFDLLETPPGRQAFLGTDRLGRDVLSRVIHGAQQAILLETAPYALAMAGRIRKDRSRFDEPALVFRFPADSSRQ